MRARSYASLVAAALMLILPVHAWAQDIPPDEANVRDRVRPEYDPLGLRLGGFDLNATLDLGAASTDNVFATETGEQEDLIFSVSPSARLSSHWSRHSVSFIAGADFTSHEDFSSEDTETGYVGADGRLDIGANSQVFGIARLAQQVEPRTNPDALIAAEPVEYERSELAVGAQHTFNRLRLRGTFATVEYDYDDADGIDQDFRDSTEDSVTLRAEAEITPRLGAVLQARVDERDYPNAPGLSSDGQTYLAGVIINFTDLMRGEITVGQFNREYESGAEMDGTAIAALLDWYATRLTTVQFSARQTGEDSGATVAQPYIASEYGVRVDHELLRNVIVSGGIQMGQREYENIDREDEYRAAFVGADYFLNRRVALNARYTFDDTESSGVDRYRDFTVNVISLGVSLRL
ncbi:MAG: outer membrane beta-barrel protein [Hyphomonadaceae bacterium]